MRLRWRPWPPIALPPSISVRQPQTCPRVSSSINASTIFGRGEDAQPLWLWFRVNEFQNTVDIAGLAEDKARRELRLKLIGVPCTLYWQALSHLPDSRNPTDPLSRRGFANGNGPAASTGDPDSDAENQQELFSRLGRDAPASSVLAAVRDRWATTCRTAVANFCLRQEAGVRGPFLQGTAMPPVSKWRALCPPCPSMFIALAGSELRQRVRLGTGTTPARCDGDVRMYRRTPSSESSCQHSSRPWCWSWRSIHFLANRARRCRGSGHWQACRQARHAHRHPGQ